MQDSISKKQTIICNMENIKEVALKINNFIISSKKSNNIIFLNGDLSSGKTTLVQQYVSLFSSDIVTSPTFSIIHEYSNNIFHYDLYQKSYNELLPLGIIEFLAQDGTHFIEWPNQELQDSLNEFDFEIINIDIDFRDHDERLYTII